MKTITLDYDLYAKELAEARKAGVTSGIYRATEYVKDPSTYQLQKSDSFYECERLDEAIKERIESACEAYLDKLITEEKLDVFNHDMKRVDDVHSVVNENGCVTLYVGLGT